MSDSPAYGASRAWRVLVVALTCLLWAPVAAADALVVVEVRGASGPGRVELRARDGARILSCQVDNQHCRLDGVPGGRYDVTFQGEDGAHHRSQPAMIPPSGTVKLVIPVR